MELLEQKTEYSSMDIESKKYKEELVLVIESTILELESGVFINTLQFEIIKTYRIVLLLYFKKRIDLLTELLNVIELNLENKYSIEEKELMKRIVELRLSIRQDKIKSHHISSLLHLKNSISKPLWEIWSGEIYILVAFALGNLNEHAKSNEYNQLAIISLAQLGANKKKLRAMHNYIASLTCINTSKRLIYEYLFIYKESFKQKVYDLAGLALANISREFQILGILTLAERFSRKAISLAHHNSESVHHYLIFLYRAHILLDLNKINLATELIQYCKKSPFSEIQGGVLILENIINKTFPSKLKITKNIILLPGWLERLKVETGRRSKKIKLSAMEEKLILFIFLKKRKKDSIIFHLYGDRIDYEYIQNRFYVLVSKINKKIPNLIQCKEKSMYYLR